MTKEFLTAQILEKRSYLCVGLDTDPGKLPRHLQGKKDAVVTFNKEIIQATQDLCVAYKINTAFYEAMGKEGWQAMEETVHAIPDTHFKIADAKRADIGNTSSYYARAFFETIPFDAVTVAPYMGGDSIRPFLEYNGKWTIVLGLTSNDGAEDFEMLNIAASAGSATTPLYQRVISTVSSWGNENNLMFVVGATQAAEVIGIRKIIPGHFLLVPGVGFQGGSLPEVSEHGINSAVGMLVNASRAIIYAGDDENFAMEAREIAGQYQTEMQALLSKMGL